MARYEYDLTVIGAGTAGLVTAAGAASFFSPCEVRGDSQTIHPYPTLSEVVRRTADAYYREKLFAGRLPRLLKRVFDFLR